MRRGLVPSRNSARRLIEDGKVRVGGALAAKPASLVTSSTPITLLREPPPYVGRGGEKLEAALDEFRIDVSGRRALDVGASIGGFTDCLLQHGARSVTAVDVGKGQLDWKLRQDPRVEVMEGVNIRHVRTLGEPFDVICVDVSFISLVTIAPALVSLGTAGTDYVLLVKPQFEAGPQDVPRGGVIEDPAVHRFVLERVGPGMAEEGLGIVGLMRSPILGAKGNVEFLAHARLGAPTPPPGTYDRVLE